MTYDGMIAESIRVNGHNGDQIDGYLARPLGAGPFPGVVLIHHMPGWDEATKEMARKFAYHGYVCISPNLHYRVGPGSIDDVVARVRTEGGNPDAQIVGDVAGSMTYLESLPYYSGKVGTIGFCSGGRQVVIVASKLKFDAAVDCWGGRVVMNPPDINERMPVAPIDMTYDLSAPLLGIFGLDDMSPSPEEVDQHEAVLKAAGKTHEFHRYEGAGHSFFAVDRPSYRSEQATDAWRKVFAWYDKHLS
jgi:carboxymethylenebutenolidase